MPPRRPSLVLLAVSTAILLDALDLSITQVALPEIGRTLDVSAGTLAWIPNGYVLSYGALLLLGGRLADLFGRRRIFLIGLALFGAMSVVGGLATSAPVLIAARVVQGAGAALTVPAAVAIIAASFAEGAARNRALGVFGASASAGFSVGLVLGGVLTDALSWRWIFLVKVPLVLAAMVLTLRAVEETRAPARPAGLDGPGALCSAAGVLLVALAITQAGDATLAPGLVAAAALAGAGLLAAFVLVERRAVAPLLPLGLFSDRTVRTADLASLTVLAAPFGLAHVTTLWMQQLLGFSALTTGLALLPVLGLSIVVSRFAAPWLLARLGLRVTATGAMLVVGAGFLFLLGIATEPRYLTALLPATLVCLGLGMGAAYPVFTIAALTGVDEERQGVASGVQNTALQVGGGCGLALVSTVVTAAAGRQPRPEELADALRLGAVAGAALPLIGAAVVWVGLGRLHGSTAAESGSIDENGSSGRKAVMGDGAGDKAKGNVKEAAGDLTGHKDLEREGKVDQTSGSIKDKVGDAADGIKDALKRD